MTSASDPKGNIRKPIVQGENAQTNTIHHTIINYTFISVIDAALAAPWLPYRRLHIYIIYIYMIGPRVPNLKLEA
jgi:hypothetical protein